MPSEPPVSVSDGSVEEALESQVEIELQSRREELALGISRYLVHICAVVSIILVMVWFLARLYPQILIYAVLILLLALGAGIYPAFQRRKRTTAGLLLLSALSLMVVLSIPLLFPSLMPVVAIWNVSAMMIVMILLGDRASRWLVGAFALAYLADVVLVAILGWSPFPPLEHDTGLWVTGVASLVGILAAALIIRLIVLGLARQFRRAQRLNLELERRIHEVNVTREALQQERNLLRTLIDTVPANVYIKDIQSRFVDANTETIRTFGAKDSNDLIGKTDSDFFMPDLAAKYFADDQAVIHTGQPLLNIEERAIDQLTRQDRWLLTTKVPIRNEHSEVTGLVGVGLDITERKRVEEALRESEKRHSIVSALISDYACAYHYLSDDNDDDAQMEWVFGAFEEISGHSAETAPNHFGLSQPVHPDDLSRFRQRQRNLRLGQADVSEFRIINKQSKVRWVLAHGLPEWDAEHQRVTRVYIAVQDITERKQAEAQAFALAAEQQRVKLLRDFIADVSHDLRTPLSIIGTTAYLVGKTTDIARQAQYVQRIEEQISRLKLLLDNFVELADLEQQASSFQFRPTDLGDLVKTLVERSQPEVVAKHQHLEYRCEPPSALVLGDAKALSKAITQVVNNAIHFTPDEGKITIRLYNNDENAVIEVADTGIGIRATDLPHIFDSFYRVDSARSSESGGAGLGLSIAKRNIELMKGNIEVQSEFGVGTVFKVYLPIHR